MKLSKRNVALAAGVSLLIMAAVAAFSFGYVHSTLVVEGSPAETYRNLQLSGPLFIGGIAGWIIILICDVLAAWALYYFFKEVNKNLSLATAWIRVIYAAVLGVAIYNLIAVLPLAHTSGNDTTDNAKPVIDYLTAFETIWSAGLIIFGVHLLGLGYLSLKADFVPGIFGWLLLVAGISYFFLNLAKAIPTGSEQLLANIETILSIPMAIAEIGFALWLVISGGKTKSYTRREIQADTLTIGKSR